MTLSRRAALAIGASLLAATAPWVLAQETAAEGTAAQETVDYPVETVTLITHSSPGGGSDVLLRDMVPYLSEIMPGVTFVAENPASPSSWRTSPAAAAPPRPPGSPRARTMAR